MRNRSWIVAAILLFCAPPLVRADAAKVGDFALLDHQGAFHQLSRYADQKAVVIFVQGNSCPIVRLALPALKQSREKFADKGIPFLMLNANVQDDLPAIRKEAGEFGIDFPILKDDTQLVAESLGIVRTGEVLVIKPETKEIVYRGPIDDHIGGYEAQKDAAANSNTKHYLQDALAAVLEGKPIERPVREAKGCLVAYPTRGRDQARKISYADEIASILTARCVKCHVEGGIGPFAMNSHKVVEGWAPMMVETIMTKRMPPGQIDMEVGDWLDVHHMSPKEQVTFVHWVNSGTPNDDEKDPLALIPPRGDHAWTLGEPDYVIEVPPQEVPATGIIPNKLVTIPLKLDEDRWVRAYEFNIGQRDVTHHITTSMVVLGKDGQPKPRKSQSDNPIGEGARAIDADDPDGADPRAARSSGFAGYAPGKPIAVYPPDVGYRVTPNMALRASLHYTTNGKVTTDNSRIGLYFYPKDQPPKYEIRRWSAGTNKFLIPPHVHDYAVQGESTVPVDTYVYNMQPHMHYRGKRVTYTAHYPDGKVEKLLNVPNYSYLWQMIYTPKKPIFLPAGTKVVVSGAFDNSAMNPHNPAPDQEVKPGAQTWEEMFIGHIQVGPADPANNAVQYGRASRE